MVLSFTVGLQRKTTAVYTFVILKAANLQIPFLQIQALSMR